MVMREYKFCGISLLTGEWVYGDLWSMPNDGYAIVNSGNQDCTSIDFNPISVDPETVGEYTGLKDKNGVEIYEGDIVKVWMFDFAICEENPPIKPIGNYEVYYDSSEGLYSIRKNEDDWTPNHIGMFKVEVIGNIHQNPELLAEGSV